MRRALTEFRDSQDVDDDVTQNVVGDIAEQDADETLELRAPALERENRDLRETVQAQAEELEALRRQVSELEEREPSSGGHDTVDEGQGQPEKWRPPRRGHGLPDAGVVTLEEQPDEATRLRTGSAPGGRVAETAGRERSRAQPS